MRTLLKVAMPPLAVVELPDSTAAPPLGSLSKDRLTVPANDVTRLPKLSRAATVMGGAMGEAMSVLVGCCRKTIWATARGFQVRPVLALAGPETLSVVVSATLLVIVN